MSGIGKSIFPTFPDLFSRPFFPTFFPDFENPMSDGEERIEDVIIAETNSSILKFFFIWSCLGFQVWGLIKSKYESRFLNPTKKSTPSGLN